MGIKYLWDTNTAIYYLQKKFPPGAEQFIDGLVSEEKTRISVITEIELLSWKDASPNDLAVLGQFIQKAVVMELETAIKLKTAELRKMYRVKLPDAIIASTALVYGLALLSRNVSDFAPISGLILVNPWDK